MKRGFHESLHSCLRFVHLHRDMSQKTGDWKQISAGDGELHSYDAPSPQLATLLDDETMRGDACWVASATAALSRVLGVLYYRCESRYGTTALTGLDERLSPMRAVVSIAGR